jgi:hypothetical protein
MLLEIVWWISGNFKISEMSSPSFLHIVESRRCTPCGERARNWSVGIRRAKGSLAERDILSFYHAFYREIIWVTL